MVKLGQAENYKDEQGNWHQLEQWQVDIQDAKALVSLSLGLRLSAKVQLQNRNGLWIWHCQQKSVEVLFQPKRLLESTSRLIVEATVRKTQGTCQEYATRSH